MTVMNQTISTTEEKLRAQIRLTKESQCPLFVPSDGICFICRKDIFNAYTVDYCRHNLITGCPFCNWSFVG